MWQTSVVDINRVLKKDFPTVADVRNLFSPVEDSLLTASFVAVVVVVVVVGLRLGPASDESDASAPPLPFRYGQNVHPPEFYDFPASVRVNESVAEGTALVRLRARDRDHGYNGLLVYALSVVDGDGDGDDSALAVEPETGLLRVAGPLDRERRSVYNLNVTVYDLGTPQRSVPFNLDLD